MAQGRGNKVSEKGRARRKNSERVFQGKNGILEKKKRQGAKLNNGPKATDDKEVETRKLTCRVGETKSVTKEGVQKKSRRGR